MAQEVNIRHIAQLARLHIEENDLPRFEREMGEIVAMVEKLPEFEDTRLPLNEKDAMPLRKDKEGSSLEREKILRNAPKTEAGCIVVPKVVE